MTHEPRLDQISIRSVFYVWSGSKRMDVNETQIALATTKVTKTFVSRNGNGRVYVPDFDPLYAKF